MTNEQINEYHLKRLYGLSLNSQGNNPQLSELNEEQDEWVNSKLKDSNLWPKVHENAIGDWKNWRSFRNGF